MTTLQNIPASASPEVPANDNFATLSANAIFGKRQPVTTGLTWGYYGGLYNGNTVADGTVTLTNAADNYVVVLRSTGVVSVSTSSTNSLDPLYAKLYKLTCAGSVVTAEVDQRKDANGLLFFAGGTTFDIDALTAASAIGAADLFAVSQSTSEKKATGAQLRTYIRGGIFDPTDYGCVGDGTTDDSTNFAAMMTAVNAASAGALVVLPPGKTFKTSGGFTFSVQTRIVGAGCSGSSLTGTVAAISTVTCTSTTAHLLTFAAAGCSIEGVHLADAVAGTRTAGAALRVTSGNGMRFENFSTYGFYNAIQVEDGFEWRMARGFIYGPINYGLYLRNIALPDGGDAAISDMHIVSVDRAAAAAVYLQSGGGVKFTNLKINERGGNCFTNGIFLDVASSVSTSILLVSNSSIENTTGSGVKVRIAAGSNWNHIGFHGVQFSQYLTTTFSCIDVLGISGAGVDRMVINGCIFQGASATTVPAIKLDTVDNVAISGNVFDSFTALYSATNCSGIAAGISATQTGEMMAGFIASPSNKSYKVVVKAAHAGTITETTTICAIGTCTATFKINTTALGGTANSVSSTKQSQAQASANAFAAGDDIVITISANSSCADMSFCIKYTRTLA